MIVGTSAIEAEGLKLASGSVALTLSLAFSSSPGVRFKMPAMFESVKLVAAVWLTDGRDGRDGDDVEFESAPPTGAPGAGPAFTTYPAAHYRCYRCSCM
jgi:hypothetical protein